MKSRAVSRASEYIAEGGGAGAFANKTWDEIDKANGLSQLKQADYALFKNLYKQKYGVDYNE
jgi:hypothetical protein